MNKVRIFFSNPIFYSPKFVTGFWFCVAFIGGIKQAFQGIETNYPIYKYVFYHTLEQVNLYSLYPASHTDCNHYGPLFSLIIAPFAMLPDSLSTLLWALFMALCLYLAIVKLPIDWRMKSGIFYISAHELLINAMNTQINLLITALIIGTLISVRKEKDIWAACFIALGLFIKLYGIVGFAFFFFSRHKLKLVGYFFLWSAVFFVLPMLISSPGFIIQSYQDWYHSLIGKNVENIMSMSQDISAMGMVRRITGYRDISNLVFLIPALFLFALQYLKVNLYHQLNYQLNLLASVLLFLVLFSSGSESPTYIIAMTGVGIWFVIQKKYTPYISFLLVFALLLTSLSSSDIFPAYVRTEIIKKYSLKALPCLLIWLTLVFQVLKEKGYTQVKPDCT